MDQLGMKTLEAGIQAAANVKPGVKTGEVTDDFRKLLREKGEDVQGSKDSQGNKDSQDSKEVSGDAKQEKTDAADDTKKAGDTKDKTGSEETGKTEEAGDTKQAEELLAAQLRERFTYGFAQLGQESAETAAVEASVVQTGLPEAAVQMQTAGTAGLTEAQETDAVQTVQAMQTEQADELVQMIRPEQTVGQKENMSAAQNGADVNPAEAKPVAQAQSTSESGQEAQDFSSSLRNTEKTSQTETKSQEQPEDSVAAQEAAAMAVPTGAERTVRTEEARPQETVTTVQVEQPEELPEKVADQLLAKMAEGVKEIEIQIEPMNLGKISVKILYENNQATVSIVCSEKHTMDLIGQKAQEIGSIIDRNLGGETTIIVEKQEMDYLNQKRDENEQAGQDARQQKEGRGGDQSKEDAEQFLQKLRLGLTGLG